MAKTVDENGSLVIGSPAHMRMVMENEAAFTDVQDKRAIIEGIQAGILAAQSDDEVFEAGEAGLLSGEDMLEKPLAILGYAFNRSGFDEGGLPVYAVITALDLSQEGKPEVQFSLGGETCLTQLFRWESLERFTERAKRGGFLCAIKSKPTKTGNTVLYFRPLTAAEKQLAK